MARKSVKDKNINNKYPTLLKKIAYHEAGHAVIALHLDLGIKRVSIKPEGMFMGTVSHKRPFKLEEERIKVGIVKTRLKMEDNALCSLAGPHAQKRFNSTGCGRRQLINTDHINVYKNIEFLFPDEHIMDTYFKFLNAWSKFLVDRYWDQIEAVAQHLLEKETISGVELINFLEDYIENS